MKNQLFAFLIILCFSSFSFAEGSAYNGPDNPIIPADKEEIRLKLDQCITDLNDVFTDNDTHDAAKELCRLRQEHAEARQAVLKGLADLVVQYKGVTNHDHDQQLGETISLIQTNISSCINALASQEYCHNINCETTPELDATFCEKQALTLINRILGR
ncbi:hypothetical protein [Legionella waltersii]|uniref:Uncharacterized protein n=1 Tax=Legionella waltersii TaxID=66969 RepID=A0A0W1ABT1_9GAMM|nr:hypothetical protein [Legionella waltersii]KTD78805.1 hypothetical protein Lwal_1575 [Legionella waltersii]SNV11053.1 Uncharacterised protein [Legionella waltersii]